MNREGWDAARRLARPHGGYIGADTLLHCGVDRFAAARAVKSGTLIRRFPGVYSFAPEPQEPRLQAWAALLACGDGAALHDDTALAIYELRRSWPPTTSVITPHRRHPRGVRILHAEWLTPEDVGLVRGVPTLSPALTVLYTLHRFGTEPRRIRAINTLRLQHGLDPADLRTAVIRFPRHPNTLLLRATVPTLTTNPTRSGNEDLWPPFARRYDMPPYEMNVRIAGHLVDVYMPRPGLIVEIDGGQHDIQARIDAARDAEILAATGIPTLRIPDTDFRHHPAATAAVIHAEIARLHRLAD